MMQLTTIQRKRLQKLWFIYGNDGPKHTHYNHRYIQNLLEHGEDSEELYRQQEAEALTDECVGKVKEIILKCPCCEGSTTDGVLCLKYQYTLHTSRRGLLTYFTCTDCKEKLVQPSDDEISIAAP